MSLDVYLTLRGSSANPRRKAIFVREDGHMREISREEWDRLYPDREPVTCETGGDDEVFTANITHNLNTMAEAAGIYKEPWRPDESGITKAGQLIAPLRAGLDRLNADPERFRAFNPENGWGSYELLVRFVERYLEACEQFPEAEVRVWR